MLKVSKVTMVSKVVLVAVVHSLAVVTQDAKFIYWPWAAGELEAAEDGKSVVL